MGRGARIAAVAVLALAMTVLPGSVAVSPDGCDAGPNGLRACPIGGVLRNAPGGWHVLDDDAHTPVRLGSVTCLAEGNLKVIFAPAADEVGALDVASDETWAGIYHAGASVKGVQGDITMAVIKIRDRSGTVVSCANIPANQSGNFWITGFMLYREG